MIPNRTAAGVVTSLTRGGTAVPFSVSVIKGVEYAQFAAAAGSYTATYAADTTAPTVTATSPANGATGVAITAPVTATFSEAMDPATIGTATFELRDAGNAVVPATVTWDAATLTATLTPAAPLGGQATYTATVKGGATDPRAKDLSGNALAANVTWTFTTVAGPACPCTIWPGSAVPLNPSENDPGAVELGVKFRSDINGYITGIRFYKGANNTGTHIGNLWTSRGHAAGHRDVHQRDGDRLAAGHASPTPVAITANTVYVASYFAPNGGYAGDNSVLRSRGRGQPAAACTARRRERRQRRLPLRPEQRLPRRDRTRPPTTGSTSCSRRRSAPTRRRRSVTTVTPANGATGVASGTTVTAVFSEPLDPATIGTGTFELRDAANALVPATVAYSGATLAATLTPSAPLANTTTYTATIKGGAADPRVKDVAGNALAGNVTWSFTTAAPAVCPCTIWPTHRDSRHAVVRRQPRGRSRREVHRRRQRLHHGHSLLQGCRQHRHARRQPVVGLRATPGHGDVHQRDRHRLAAGHVRFARRRHGRHGLRRVVLRADRQLFGRRQLLRDSRYGLRRRFVRCATASAAATASSRTVPRARSRRPRSRPAITGSTWCSPRASAPKRRLPSYRRPRPRAVPSGSRWHPA